MILLSEVGGSRVVQKGILGLGLTMVYLYLEVALQGRRFRFV
jgi:hypothetical protein